MAMVAVFVVPNMPDLFWNNWHYVWTDTYWEKSSAFMWGSYLLSHSSLLWVSSTPYLGEEERLGSWPVPTYSAAQGTSLHSRTLIHFCCLATRTQATPWVPVTLARTITLVQITTVLEGQNRTWALRLIFLLVSVESQYIDISSICLYWRWLK